MKHICPRCFVAEDAEYEGQSVIDPAAYPLAKKYAEFNARFFQNRLPKIPLLLAQMKVSDVPKPLGVVLLQRPGNRFSFALLSDTVARNGTDDLEKLFAYAVKIGQLVSASIWSVTGPAWTAIARDMTVGRVLTHKVKFFILAAKDMPLLDELKHRGELLRTVGTRPLAEKRGLTCV